MYPSTEDLKELIAQAEAGEVEAAREGLRDFTRKRPSVLLAWKWLADVAGNPKERAEAIRRAQLLAPGDPWVIEAKKHRMPPARAPKRADEAMRTRPLKSPISASAPPPAAVAEREPAPEDPTTISHVKRSAALQQAIDRTQSPADVSATEPPALVRDAPVVEEPDDDDDTLPHVEADAAEDVSSLDVTQAVPAASVPPVAAPSAAPEPATVVRTDDDRAESRGRGDLWLIVAVVGLAVVGLGLLVAAMAAANVF